MRLNHRMLIGVLAAVVSWVCSAHATVLFSEAFDNLSAWTVADADGAGSAGVVEATGGKLHVVNGTGSSSVTNHGLYAGEILPSGNARVYFWSVNAVGSRTPANADNGNGPVGTFNLSTTNGVVDAFGGAAGIQTPAGFYIRSREVDSAYPGEVLRIVDENNPDPHLVMDEGVSYDFMVAYSATQVDHYYKRSSSNTWNQLGTTASATLSGSSLYLNISAWSDFHSGGSGEAADWTMEHIDVTTLDHAVLTAPQTNAPSVLFHEPFRNLSAWTMVDEDGDGTAAQVVISGGKLRFINQTDNSVKGHGVYAGQVAPAWTAKVYFWGVAANGTWNTGDAYNAGGGPVGTFNLSTANGLDDFANAKVGFYIRHRDAGSDARQTEAMRIVANQNTGSCFVMQEGVSYDLQICYDNTRCMHYYKLSSSDTWTQIDSAATITPSGSGLYLNLNCWGKTLGSPWDEGADWTMEQIDVTTRDYPTLTRPYVPPPAGTVISIR